MTSLETPTVLITGGFGCIGAETAKWLLRHSDVKVVVASRKVTPERIAQSFPDADLSRLKCCELDVQSADQIVDILTAHKVSHIVHMAALQTPDCNTHRDLGLQINLAGTQNLIEAMKRCGGIERFIFASSIAVYGPRSTYKTDRVPMLAEPAPVNVYGAWKLAGEHISRIFHNDTGVATISLRPGVLFGPGRDAGLTSAPTTAMKHIAKNESYEIPFRSRQDYQYAPDVGAAVCRALLDPFDGYGVFTLPGQTVDTFTLVEEMRKAVAASNPAQAFQISVGTEEVPFVCDLDFQPFLDAFPNTPVTDLGTAVAESIAVFRNRCQKEAT